MSKQDKWDALKDWVVTAQRHLNIEQWDITIGQAAAESDAWADIMPHIQAESAELRLSHDFWHQTLDKQRAILTHELLHLITCRTDQVFESLEEPMGKVLFAVLEPQYDNASERAVDHIALLIAPILPMPTWSSK